MRGDWSQGKWDGEAIPEWGSIATRWRFRCSGELQFFTSMCRKNPVRGRVIDKKRFIRIRCSWDLKVGRWEGAIPQGLSGLQFYNQRKRGEGVKITLFLIFWINMNISIISSSSMSGRGVFLSLHGQARIVMVQWKWVKRWQHMLKMVNHLRF